MTAHVTISSAYEALNGNFVLVLTTNSTERDAFIAVMEDVVRADIEAHHRGARIGRLGDRFIVLANGTSGAQEETSVGKIARSFLGRFAPRPVLVLLVGVAWGNPQRLGAGDVLISSEVCAANHTRISAGQVSRRTKSYVSPVTAIDDLTSKLNSPLRSFAVGSGPLVSAEIHLSDTDSRNALLAAAPHALGGDMESYDLVPELKVPWLIVRGISDFGEDGTDRAEQSAAARNAVSIVPPLITQLQLDESIPAPRTDRASWALRDALSGNAIRIAEGDCRPAALNTYLNDEIGPRLIHKLSGYSSEGDDDGQLTYKLADALLELAQNALRHGEASHVTLTFGESSVIFTDDGRAFNPARLAPSTGNGGSIAWDELDRAYVRTGVVGLAQETPKSGGNIYRFAFLGLSDALTRARRDCRVQLDWSTPAPRFPRLRYNSACEEVFFDVSDILMSSRRLGFREELRALLSKGIGVYLACRDASQVLQFENELSGVATDKLRIFVAKAG